MVALGVATEGAAAQLASGAQGGTHRALQGGVQGSWGSDTEFGGGVRVVIPLNRLVDHLETAASFDFYFGGPDVGADMSAWEVNFNVVYRFAAPTRSLTPYAGVGFNTTRMRVSTRALGVDLRGDETESGVNVLGGVILESGRVRPFAEGRFLAGDQQPFVASVGVRF